MLPLLCGIVLYLNILLTKVLAMMKVNLLKQQAKKKLLSNLEEIDLR